MIVLEDRIPATEHRIRTTRRNERKKTVVPKSSQLAPKLRRASRKRYESPEEPEIYKHQRLDTSTDEIRLLKLSRETKGPVHCEVKVFPLERAPPYVALSYRWGLPSPLHDIHIEGKVLKIRDILNSCLLELREELNTWLWVDQICIAQMDTSERNHQVGIMARIYGRSAFVIIWLGDIPLAYPREDDRFNDRDLDEESAVLLLKNKYFRRMWIIQEILLAKKIWLRINGHRNIAWSTIEDRSAGYAAVFDPEDPYPIFLTFFAFGPKRALQKLPLGLLLTMSTYNSSECEDPRDKVYGLMGIVREQDKLVVDYRKSNHEVYLDAIMIMLRAGSIFYLHCSIFHTLGKEMGIEKSLIRDTRLWLEGTFGTSPWLEAMDWEEFDRFCI